MAFIANTAFEARITNNDRDNLSHIAGLFQASGVAADCSAGVLCVRNGQADCVGYSGVKNENTWIMNAATTAADVDAVIYACDTYDNQLVTTASGNSYFVGTETLGLGVPAGRYGNFTRIDFDNQSVYRFGAGNVTINTAGDTYLTITANGLLTSQTAAPTTQGTIYFKVIGSGNFTVGTQAGAGYYDVQACTILKKS